MSNVLAGRYSLTRQIGAGKHCIVFEALDLKLNRAVAVKLVAPASASVPNVAQRLESEGRIAATLSHPHIGTVMDIGRLDTGSPFLVLELLDGETLAARIERRGPLPLTHALDIGEQLLAGLGAAHARGVVHRDVKPANVFLVDVGIDRTIVKLIDFGIARITDMLADPEVQRTETGFVVGTPEYMSPEQVRGGRDFDARTDVYAAGIVFHEMIRGVRPFGDRPPAEMLEAIAFEAVPPLASVAPLVPPIISRAIDLAVARQRERRHADANAFLRALRAVTGPAHTGVTAIVTKEPEGDWDLETLATKPPSGA
jgi:eukaryotic-like serine/threonine-protein kinase